MLKSKLKSGQERHQLSASALHSHIHEHLYIHIKYTSIHTYVYNKRKAEESLVEGLFTEILLRLRESKGPLQDFEVS